MRRLRDTRCVPHKDKDNKEKDKAMTIRDLQYNIQSAIDTAEGITDNAAVKIWHGKIYAVEVYKDEKGYDPSRDKWHEIGTTTDGIYSGPYGGEPITYGNPREKDDGTTYTLPELAEKVHIDSWVEGITAMCNIDAIRKEVYDMAGMVEDEDNPICPGEFETEYTELAEKYHFRFNRKGQIVSYNLKAGKEGDKMEPVKFSPFSGLKITAKVDWDFDEGDTPPDPKFEVTFTPDELKDKGILEKAEDEAMETWLLYEDKLEEFLSDYLTDSTDFCHKGFKYMYQPIAA